MTCAWCRGPVPPGLRRDALFCSKVCRQTAFRLRRRGEAAAAADRPIRVAYADPPYPGLAARYYADEPTYAGEVDHDALVARLMGDFPDGWALSTSARALRAVLPMCPASAHVCPWVKPGGVPPATAGLHTTWEALIVVGGRQQPPGRRDWLCAHPARRGGELPGRKPLAFCAFLFAALGLAPGDELVDLFPGTGVIGRAWAEASRVLQQRRVAEVLNDASRSAENDASAPAPGDASPVDDVDASPDVASDASPDVASDASLLERCDGWPGRVAHAGGDGCNR